MADLQQTIKLVFEGVDNATTTIGRVTKSLQDINLNARAVTEPAAAITTSLLKIEAAALVAGTALVGLAVEKAGQFNTQFKFITTLFDTSSEAAGKFREEILAYAKGSTQSLDVLNESLQTAIGQGIQYKDALGLMAIAEKLAVAQHGSMSDATKLLVSTLNAYGVGIDQATQFSDIFSASIRDGGASLQEMQQGMAQITPLAATSGVGLDQLGAALATLTKNGVPAANAFTEIRDLLSKIINPTQSAAELAQSLGINFGVTALKSKGLAGVLEDVQRATGGNVEQMAKLFTTDESLNGALLLSANHVKNFRDELGSMKSSTGLSEDAFKKMADSFELTGQRLKNTIEVALIQIGTPLEQTWGDIAKNLGSIFTTIGDSFDKGALKPILQAVQQLGQELASQLATIAKNLPQALEQADLSGFTDGLKTVAQALEQLFKGLNLDTPQGLANAITQLGQGFNSLTTYSKSVLEGLGPLFSVLKQIADTLINLNPETLKLGGNITGWMTAFNTVSPALDTLLLGFLAFGDKVPKAIGLAGDALIGLRAVLSDGAIATALGRLGIAGAFGDLVYNVTKMTGLDEKLGSWAADMAEGLFGLGTSATQAADPLGKLNQYFSDEANQAGITRQAINDWLDAQEAGAKVAGNTAQEMEHLVEVFRKQGYAYDTATGQITKLKDEFQGWDIPTNLDVKIDTDGLGRFVASYSQLGSTVKATGAFKAVASEADKAKNAIDDATKKSEAFQLKMAEIASNERIKTIELAVNLNVAKLQADVERVKATFASIDNTVTSTGNLLGDLFGAFATSKSEFDKMKIMSQIREENKRRQEALDLQKKLAEAEIKRVEAQTRALDRGDALIKIDGQGLKPELEAFMWKILELIRVRVSAEFQQYLLGVGAA